MYLLLHTILSKSYSPKGQLVNRLKAFLGWSFSYFKAGHYYSPIPNRDEITSDIRYAYNDIELNVESQLDYLKKISKYYSDIVFTDKSTSQAAYNYINRYFSYSDAVKLWCILAHEQPKRIIEIGSGYSTVCILETLKFYKLKTELQTIDIDFSRLEKLTSGYDLPSFNKIKSKVQSVDVRNFQKLENGDILFIDSSHVSKKGSDLHYILFNILPGLNSGVIIHFHDVFKNFEYPQAWSDEGIFWNEQYLLRAFLQNNDAYSILLFNDYLENEYLDWYKTNMPICLKPHEKYSVGPHKGKWIPDLRGQSLWLVKK